MHKNCIYEAVCRFATGLNHRILEWYPFLLDRDYLSTFMELWNAVLLPFSRTSLLPVRNLGLGFRVRK